MKKLVILLLKGYKILLSPLLGWRCRFVPSCSEYAEDAIKQHGVWYGMWLILRRLSKCHPLYKGKGYDPVPESILETKDHESYYVR